MRIGFIICLFTICLQGFSQVERDTVLSRCPVFITDTVTSNNFFIEARPCTLKVFRVKGDLTVVVEQKDQYLTFLFGDRKLKAGKYKINTRPSGRSELAVKYSFRSGDQVSYVDVSNGTIEVTFDKEKQTWRLKVSGMIANLVERTITYYRVRADFSIKG